MKKIKKWWLIHILTNRSKIDASKTKFTDRRENRCTKEDDRRGGQRDTDECEQDIDTDECKQDIDDVEWESIMYGYDEQNIDDDDVLTRITKSIFADCMYDHVPTTDDDPYMSITTTMIQKNHLLVARS